MAVRTDAETPRTGTTGASGRRRAGFLVAVAAWNVYVWVTRAVNLAGDPVDRSTGYLVAHGAVFGISLVLAVAVGVIGVRMWRETSPGPS